MRDTKVNYSITWQERDNYGRITTMHEDFTDWLVCLVRAHALLSYRNSTNEVILYDYVLDRKTYMRMENFLYG